MNTFNVNTSNGAIFGKMVSTSSNFSYYSFQGIPYAKPPLGDLRFKDPQPLDSWDGIRDATKEGNPCAQSDLLIQQKLFFGDEDCLVLNVYSPKLPQVNLKLGLLLPVMVWIHGGGFFSGSGSADIFGPEFLIQQDVIVVTVNYRLGILGFLSLGTEDVSGNAGLKDIVMSLKWVKENVISFGGDPNNVTIFGESAGGAAVQFLMISDIAKGLFHKAISQSGSCLNQFACTSYEDDPIKNAIKLTELAGQKRTEPADILNVLRSLKAEELVVTSQQVPTFEERKRDAPFSFAPVVEKIFPGKEAFLSKKAIELIQSGSIADVPYLSGYNSKEGILWLISLRADRLHLKTLNENFQYFVPMDLKLPIDSEKSKEVAKEIRQFYLGDKALDNETIDNYIDLMTDFAFLKDIVNSVKLHRAKVTSPIYFYRFSFDGDYNFFKKHLKIDHKGVSHEDDLGYIFNPSMTKMATTSNDSLSNETRNKVVKMWTNFAKYGNPTPETNTNLNLKWKPVTSDNIEYLEIDEKFHMNKNPDADRIKFWEVIYKKYGPKF
ncbi:juvenile hormone esterase-like [Arctopsyche grandis]|uniref:juvenile hormone esterase-like n=1 Tax=Arctopsyche grandis TaxID=121162 RepID=UPI00406D9E0F